MASDHPCDFPLEKGTRWIYEGSAEWTVNVSTVERSTQVHWATTVVDSACDTDKCLALVRGFPDELAWYQPGQEPHLGILVCKQNKLYHLDAANDEEAHELFRHLQMDTKAAFSDNDLLLDLPLSVGKMWSQDPPRDDHMYCWYVESMEEQSLPMAAASGKARKDVYAVRYSTNPDHQVMEFAPGIGITRFIYVHHGTVASADVHLVTIEQVK
jgi:hypothetical protein